MYLNFYESVYIKINNQQEIDMPNILARYQKYISNLPITIPSDKTINLVFVKSIEAGKLYYLGREAAYNESFIIFDKKGFKLSLCYRSLLINTDIKVEIGFDEHLLISILESTIFVRLIFCNVIPVHSCSVEILGDGILFPAWAGIGKTRVLLNLTSSGAKFVSDEWTFIKDDLLMPFLVDFCMFDYDIKEYASRINLSLIDKMKLIINSNIKSSKIKKVLSYYNFIFSCKYFTPDQIFPSITESAKLKKIIVLEKWNQLDTRKETIGTKTLLSKLCLSFLRENRLLFYYYNMYKFASSGSNEILDNIGGIYQQKLLGFIKEKEYLKLTLPAKIRNINLLDIL